MPLLPGWINSIAIDSRAIASKKVMPILLPELKKRPGWGLSLTLIMDQTGLALAQDVRRCWMKRGKQRQVPLNSAQKQHTDLIGAYDWVTNEVGTKRYHRLNRGTVIGFLQYLFLEGDPDEPLVLGDRFKRLLDMNHQISHWQSRLASGAKCLKKRVKGLAIPCGSAGAKPLQPYQVD